MSDFYSNMQVIDQASGQGCKFEVVEYKHLAGGRNIATAQNLFYADQAGIRLKQIRIQLHQGEAILESGALHFMKGNLQVSSQAGGSGGLAGFARGFATKMLTNESVYRPRYRGTGEIFLEPSFGHFLIFNLDRKQSLIVDKGMFYCCEGSVSVSVAMQGNISSGLFGGEGLFQTKITGPGICVFNSTWEKDTFSRPSAAQVITRCIFSRLIVSVAPLRFVTVKVLMPCFPLMP
mgnify:CR=1 FL=1